jgi:hypothetical protein
MKGIIDFLIAQILKPMNWEINLSLK